MNYDEALKFIHDTSKYGSKLGLQNITELLKRLGNPHKSFPSVHVAGTNGKGSVSAMTASILHQAGYKTGLFISPYLERFTERIQVDFKEIPKEALAELIGRIKYEIDGMVEDGFNHPTEFELVTALGFLWFARQEVDIAVIEVGLGGRLDATNVITPVVSIITSISFDHTRILGNSLSEIVYEKGGIIKPGVPLVSYPQPPEAEKVLKGLAEERGCPYYFVAAEQVIEKNASFNEQHFDFAWKDKRFTDLIIRLPGRHQQLNAACALSGIMILKESGFDIPDQAVYAGLEKARWPGRLEKVMDKPFILLDGAHNPAGAAALAETVKQYFYGKKVHLILGILQDKDAETVAKILCSIADSVSVTRSSSPRSILPDELAAVAGKYHADVRICDTLEKAISYGLEWARDDMKDEKHRNGKMLVISGSLYLIGEARQIIRRINKEQKMES